MARTKRLARAVCLLLFSPATAQDVAVTGEDGVRQWHKITLTLTGPQASEGGTPNPFLNYRMTVTFSHPDSGLSYTVPGYFAADGNAGESSASSGDTWRAHLSPDHTGEWEYSISFRQGSNVAVSDSAGAGTPFAPYDGVSGTFTVQETDKIGRDHRGKGRLQYVNKHHLQFACGEYFLKAGADAPENFLAYDDFDNTPDHHGYRKSWAPHVRDWQEGDPTWKGGKGKGIIGALNYLAEKGMNAFSFLTYSHNGDDDNVFPYVNPNDPSRMDCSKLDQWELVFEHADALGLYLHFKTQETENDQDLDGGDVGTERKLYYRELIARYAHHLALNWNLGEENSQSTSQRRAMAQYFWDHDPYRHHIVIHNGKQPDDLLGNASKLTGYSIQTGPSNVFDMTLEWIDKSAGAGRPWVCANDEQNPANEGVKPDADDFWHNTIRTDILWGSIMAGGGGVEYYFGYNFAHSDLTCEDFRSRDHMWELSRYALTFFKDHEIPFWNMQNRNNLVSSSSAWCLAGEHHYVVYLKNGGSTNCNLAGETGVFEVKWFDPRNGGSLNNGSVQAVNGGGNRALGTAPSSSGQDWAILVRPADPDRNYPPAVSAGDDQAVMLPRNGDSVTVELDGTVTDDGKPAGTLTTAWSKQSGTGTVDFDDAGAVDTSATITGEGVYVLRLTADDGELVASDTGRIEVAPFSSHVTMTYRASDDAFIEGSNGHNTEELKVENDRRTSYLKFNVTGLPAAGAIESVTLRLTENGDNGNGTLRFYRGSHNNWTEGTLSPATAPAGQTQVGARSGSVGAGQTIEVDVTPLVTGNGTYTIVITMDAGGNDIWFGSDESSRRPELIVVAEEELDELPSVAITVPHAGATFASGEQIEVLVDASDPEGALQNVELFVNATSQGVDAAPPYRWLLAAVPDGAHTIRAVATDGGGNAAEDSVTILVTAGLLPPGQTVSDIGAVSVPVTAAEEEGVYAISAAGAGLGGTADSCGFVHLPFHGDGEVLALVENIDPADSQAVAGVMIRESLDPGAACALMGITAAGGVMFLNRPEADQASVEAAVAGIQAPQWVRLVRQGDIITGYHSAGGAEWTLAGGAIVPMAADVLCGIAVTAHDGAVPAVAVVRSFRAIEAGGPQIPGDCNQDGALDISDPICLLRFLFLAADRPLPCAGESVEDGGNGILLNFNGDVRNGEGGAVTAVVNLADPVAMLQCLFAGGRPHVLGKACTSVPGCPPLCTMAAPTVVRLVHPQSPATILVPENAGLGLTWTERDFDDTAWLAGSAAVGYDEEETYVPYFTTDVAAAMLGVNATAYIRIPFVFNEPGTLDRLLLRLRYDDGFVAYLNGEPVADDNAPAVPSWDAEASATRNDDRAVIFEEFDITDAAAAMERGENVLAIHGLNHGDTSSDFLIAAALVAELR